MIDFTSALYLGMRHPSLSLRPWRQLSLGVPAALTPPPGAAEVARRLAQLQGCEHAVLAPSTLHLAWDFLGRLGEQRVAFYVDAGSYPVLRWGVERAAGRGTPVRSFPHHDADALGRLLRRDAHRPRRPVVVTDGWCPRCGEAAPLRAYVDAARRYGGHVVLDDTQALGVLGAGPTKAQPYGYGGGGLLRWAGIESSDVTVIASLAKGFGAPVAVLAGSRARVRAFEHASETRVHCSPPSIAVVHAAARALHINVVSGEARRAKLFAYVLCLQRGLASLNVRVRGDPFPVQVLGPTPHLPAALAYRRLRAAGIRAVLFAGPLRKPPRIGFVLRADHEASHLRRVLAALRAFGSALDPVRRAPHRRTAF